MKVEIFLLPILIFPVEIIMPRFSPPIMNSAFSPIMSSSFCSLLVCGKVRVCLYTLGNVVRQCASSLLGSYVQQEYYVAVIQM